MDWIKASFSGFDGWSFPKEPILWLTLIGAIINAVVQSLAGDITGWVAIETVIGLIMAFMARGKVSPVAKL